MDLDQELSWIERMLWTNDVEVHRKTFLPDAVIIFPEIGRVDLEFALNALRDENAADHRWAEVAFQARRCLARRVRPTNGCLTACTNPIAEGGTSMSCGDV